MLPRGEGRIGVKPGLIIALGSILLVAGGGVVAQQGGAVPDAPAPQPAPALQGIAGPITPGQGSNEKPGAGSAAPSAGTASSSGAGIPGDEATPAPPQPAVQPKDNAPTTPPEFDSVKDAPLYSVHVNYVDLPVTVKDKKGHQVPGLTWRDFRIFENGEKQDIKVFISDPSPLSMAFVIDQSVTADVMAKVNESLDSIQGALTSYDEIAVFSYSHGSQERTAFTGAQSARVPAVLALTRSTGAEELVPINSGPFDSCGIHENGACVDPNLQSGKSAGNGYFMTIPKEIHTLNDAILAAAKELSTRPKERRRIIYVISDGKEAGSKATYKEVLHYLQAHDIAVYGTLVGDSARWGEGYLSRFHLPGQMYDNRLTGYVIATGGTLDSENGVRGIENSYAEIAKTARTQYTLGYYSREPFIDGKYRRIEVRVERPDLEVVSKLGYYPSALDIR